MTGGFLLINLGTPQGADVPAVRSYLREFLTDKRVIDLPAPLRYLLVYAFILPFRPQKSAKAYQKIWTDEGSPLLVNTYKLSSQLQHLLGSQTTVAIGMRYGKPSIQDAINQLSACTTITVLPLFPQYSSAATGSALEEAMRIFSSQEVMPSLKIIRDFYQHPAYVNAQAQKIKTYLSGSDHLLFSYHGIPERQISKSGCKEVCPAQCPPISSQNANCYKAQCYETSQLLAKALQLNPKQYSTAFQSRLGKTPWIKPYTDEVLRELAANGVKHLSIACPSFVADCLETLEEIGMQAKKQWLSMGGEQLTLIPCMNDDPTWVSAIPLLNT